MYIAENTLKPLSPVSIMSSTTNAQNLLTNVFRPRFTYNALTSNYQTTLEIKNIDSVSANSITAYAANVGDASGNVYVGIGAGRLYSDRVSSSNSNNTFVGTTAGGSTTNVKNGVFLGYSAGLGTVGSSNSISIGANTLNGGNSNVYIGCGTGITTGSNNIFLGPGLTSVSSISNTLLIGSGTNTTIVGDLVGKRVGINLSSLPATPPVSIALDINGFTRVGTNGNGMLGVGIQPGTYNLDVLGDMRIQDGVGTLTFSNGTQTSTEGFTSATGATTGSTTTIPLKKGMFMVSAISNTTVHGYVGISYDSSHQTVVSSNAGGLITSNAGNVTIAVNTTWTVTYFPSP